MTHRPFCRNSAPKARPARRSIRASGGTRRRACTTSSAASTIPTSGGSSPKTQILGHLTVPQSLNRYVYAVNNPLRYVDPTGEDWWNPFSWGQDTSNAVSAAASAVGDWWASSSIWDKLDMAMTIVAFIPGLDVVSDAYFLGKAIVDVVQGKGSWTDIAMNAEFLLAPAVGGAYFRAAKTALNALDGLGDAGKAARRGSNAAEAAQDLHRAEPSQLRNGKQYHKAFDQTEAGSQAARGHTVGKDVLFNKGIPVKDGHGVGIGGGKRVRPDETRLFSNTIIEFKPFDEKASLFSRYGSQIDSYREAYRSAQGVDPKIFVQTYFG